MVEASLKCREGEMGLKTPVPVVLFVLLTVTCACAQQPGKSAPSSSSAWNDNLLIAVQKRGGDPARPGDVKIQFYGHNAFKISSPGGLSILTDPWRNDSTGDYPKWFLREFPAVPVDIVLSTHAHFDHDAIERPQGLMVLGRMVGRFKIGDVEITGLADKHKCDPAADRTADRSSGSFPAVTCPPNNVMGFDNAIEIIETGGLRIAVWGDNRPVPDPSLDHFLTDVDVLILPVETILTSTEVSAIVRKYDPKAVIPAHYFVKGLTTDVSGLDSADGWVKEQEKVAAPDVHRLGSAEFTLKAADLKGAHHRVYYFGDHIEK